MSHNLIDTHAHLYHDQFTPDFNQIIQRAKDANLKVIINIGADIESSKKSLKLESSQIKFYSSIGIHPHEVSKMTTSESIHANIDEVEVIKIITAMKGLSKDQVSQAVWHNAAKLFKFTV